MKKFFYAIALFLLSTTISNLKAQNNCAVITVEPEANSQSGIYRVKVSLNQSYDQQITVSGVIRDETNLSTETPFSVTVPNGNTTAATDYFFEISPEGDLNWIVNTITPSMVTKNGVNYGTQGLLGACFGEVTSAFLATDNDFIQYAEAHNNVIDLFENVVANMDSSQLSNLRGQLDYYRSVGTLTEQETTQFSSLIGFPSLQNFNTSINTAHPLLSSLKNKYSVFESTDLEASKNLIISAFDILFPPTTSTICSAKYNNCVQVVKKAYFREILGCTGMAIGFGMMSFGTVGVVYQVVCGINALDTRITALNGCEIDRQICINSQ